LQDDWPESGKGGQGPSGGWGAGGGGGGGGGKERKNSVKCYDHQYMMNLKVFGWKRTWLFREFTEIFLWEHSNAISIVLH
jgi:hypothetical protein